MTAVPCLATDAPVIAQQSLALHATMTKDPQCVCQFAVMANVLEMRLVMMATWWQVTGAVQIVTVKQVICVFHHIRAAVTFAALMS